MADDYWNYDYCVLYLIVISLCCTTETNIMLNANYISIKNSNNKTENSITSFQNFAPLLHCRFSHKIYFATASGAGGRRIYQELLRKKLVCLVSWYFFLFPILPCYFLVYLHFLKSMSMLSIEVRNQTI